MDIRMYVQTEFLPILQDFVPLRGRCQLKGSEGQLKGSEGQLKGSEVLLKE